MGWWQHHLDHLKYQVKIYNMERDIMDIIDDYKNSPNKDLVLALDYLHKDFEKTKKLIIDLTHHLDSTEKVYHNILKEYEKRIPK